MRTLCKLVTVVLLVSLMLSVSCAATADTLRIEGLDSTAQTSVYIPYRGTGTPDTARTVDATWVSLFKSQFPNDSLSVNSKGSSASTEKLIQSLSSGYKADVLRLDTYYQDVHTVMASGELLDLSGSEKLTAIVLRMHPNIAQMAYHDGKLYAVPMDVTALFSLSAVSRFWYNAGYSNEDIPTSFEAYLSFMENWLLRLETDPYAFQWGLFNYQNTNYSSISKRLEHGPTAYITTIFVRQYVDNCRACGIVPTFNSPLILSFLERISTVGDELFHKDHRSGSGLLIDNFGHENELDWTDRLAPVFMIPSRLTDDDQLVFPMRMYLLAVNADAENPELAIRFLEMYASMIADPVWPDAESLTNEDADRFYQWAELFADAKGDVTYPLQRSTGYHQLLNLAKEYSTAMPKLLAGNEDALGHFDTLNAEKNVVTHRMDTIDTLIFAENLVRYQQLVSGLSFPLGGSYIESKEVAQLIERFAKHGITPEEFAQQMDALGIR